MPVVVAAGGIEEAHAQGFKQDRSSCTRRALRIALEPKMATSRRCLNPAPPPQLKRPDRTSPNYVWL
eukprot:4705521-Amphidinium_carterae.1